MKPARTLSPTARVALLTAVLALAAGTAFATHLVSMRMLSPSTHLPWWCLALGFLGTELCVIHVDVRRDTYSISMMELPLVAGLFLASPTDVLLARLVGSAIAIIVIQRQVLVKASFNLALYAVETAVAVSVFRFFVPHASTVSPTTWGAAFAAVLAANVVSMCGVMAAMSLHGAEIRGRARRMIEGALIPPVANTGLALLAVILLWTEPSTAWLLCVIVAVLALTYRGYASLNRRYANLTLLYEFTRLLQAKGAQATVHDILGTAAELLRAERAFMVAVTDADVREWTFEQDSTSVARTVALEELDQLSRRALDERRPFFVPTSTKSETDRAALDAAGWRDCIVVPVAAQNGDTLVMGVVNRADDVSTFDDDEMQLFEALVNHSAIALSNLQLVSRLRHEAMHDSLTNLPNRALFNAQVETAIANRSPGAKLAVMAMDLDRFKEVNDTLGHHYGDQLLEQVGRRLVDALGDRGAVARLGGDEFALLLPELGDAREAFEEARRIRELLDDAFDLGGFQVDVDGTIGIALSPDHGEDPATLLQRADVAMYDAKAGLGIQVYASERDHYSPRRLALLGELRDALEKEQLELHYQPKIDVASGAVVGAEALLRWTHPTRGQVPPDEFIPVAEHTGIIRPLTLFVLRRAIEDCSRWRSLGLDIGVAVNVSAQNLMDVELVESLRAMLVVHNLRPGCVTLEITESSIMGDLTRTMATLQEFSRMGVRISVDDFGTGYSSLAYLKQLPVDEVKIDKTFVQTMESDRGDAAIVQSVIDLGANLGMNVVAEGVETATALELLRELSCTFAQGYFVHRPVPYDVFVAWAAAQDTSSVIPLRRARPEIIATAHR